MKRKRVFIVAIYITALVALMLVSGCAQQQQQERQQQQPQQPSEQLQPQPEVPLAEQQLPQQQQLPPQPSGPIEADIYEDNLNESLEELSQLE